MRLGRMMIDNEHVTNELKPATTRCEGRNAHGAPCGSRPPRGGRYCFAHDPDRAAAAAEARRLGGLRRRREKAVATSYIVGGLGSVAELRRVTEIAILDALQLDNSIARSRLLLAGVIVGIKLLEVGELERQVTDLQDVLDV